MFHYHYMNEKHEPINFDFSLEINYTMHLQGKTL